ncbi:MAG TPA: transglycosylase SLT domain-containing protein, partial [Longimicrobiaceae bacterium]|nr:transglycosylase SLT domain-containing protein [Longimicrobiaceae bacterium]
MSGALRSLFHTALQAARRRPGRAAAVAALVLGTGLGFGLVSSSVSTTFGPRVGPPDTLPSTRIPLPVATSLPETPYLERVVEPEKPPRERALEALADRYHVTETLARLIFEVAEAEGIDPELAFRLVRVESVFDVDAIGPGGALGLCQLMPGTARDIDPTLKTHKEMLEPRTNLRLGMTNLRAMIERYEGDVRLGVIAYNRGEIAVDRALRRGRDPENGYGQRVLGPRHHGGKQYSGPGLLGTREAQDEEAPGPAKG